MVSIFATVGVTLLVCLIGFSAVTGAQDSGTCSGAATRLHLIDPPYDNYFYSDCHSASHVIVTSPLPSSNLDVISPRLLVAWPAGNSGILSPLAPQNGQKGTLSIQLQNSTGGDTLSPIYTLADTNGSPQVGISGVISFNSSARLDNPVLGSIRNIREYTEGGGKLNPTVQQGNKYSESPNGGASISRTWLDNVTSTHLTFTPMNGADAIKIGDGDAPTLQFGAGSYKFDASFNYPQMTQLSQQAVLNQASQSLIQEQPDQTASLSFLSYTDKLLAGTWRFLTYFGRDSMISLLLMQSVLSEGEGGAIEAVISSVLERINRDDGTVCHEEVIGDFATLSNLANGLVSTAPSCDYKMVDTDFYLPVVMKNYFVDTQAGKDRTSAFFDKKATFFGGDSTYMQLAQLTAEKIMKAAAPFASDGGQIKENLIHLKDGEQVGEWRDSGNGLGGGRIPYDVNTALVPAALRSIAALSRGGFFPDHSDWGKTADQYALVWEDDTLHFFEVNVAQEEAKSLVQSYVSQSQFPGPSNTDNITTDVTFYGLALDGYNNQANVRVMNTDDCFRHFLLDTTNQTQLSSYLSQTADHILQPFPVGLATDVGLFVANPAYGGDSSYASLFTRADYHGTVVWSWPLAMMAAGLARQLGRCSSSDVPGKTILPSNTSFFSLANSILSNIDFCKDDTLHGKVVSAYDRLWDIIDANTAQLGNEVWSWTYDNGFKFEPIGAFTSTESNIRQLWSLTFLAVHRENYGQ